MMKFACDGMLGRLAKWLRALGVDAFYQPGLPRHRLLRIAREENRTILTRNHAFAELSDIPPFWMVPSTDPQEQLKALLAKWPQALKETKPFSRCLACNTPLENHPKEKTLGKVPDAIYRRFDDFFRCPVCQKIFWHGGHVARLSKLLPG